MKQEHTAEALRVARAIERDASLLKSLSELIDGETGVREFSKSWRTSSPKPAISSWAAAQNSLRTPAAR
jgi:hypothetical protein